MSDRNTRRELNRRFNQALSKVAINNNDNKKCRDSGNNFIFPQSIENTNLNINDFNVNIFRNTVFPTSKKTQVDNYRRMNRGFLINGFRRFSNNSQNYLFTNSNTRSFKVNENNPNILYLCDQPEPDPEPEPEVKNTFYFRVGWVNADYTIGLTDDFNILYNILH